MDGLKGWGPTKVGGALPPTLECFFFFGGGGYHPYFPLPLHWEQFDMTGSCDGNWIMKDILSQTLYIILSLLSQCTFMRMLPCVFLIWTFNQQDFIQGWDPTSRKLWCHTCLNIYQKQNTESDNCCPQEFLQNNGRTDACMHLLSPPLENNPVWNPRKICMSMLTALYVR